MLPVVLAPVFIPIVTNILYHLKMPVAKSASILLGELVAVLITLQYVRDEILDNQNVKSVHILFDSQSTF